MGEGGGHRAYNLMDRYSKATHQILCSENKEKGQDARRAPNCSVLQQKENTHTHTHASMTKHIYTFVFSPSDLVEQSVGQPRAAVSLSLFSLF